MKMYLYDQSCAPTNGDIVYFTATIRSLYPEANNESTVYLLADKISATCYDITDFNVIGHSDNNIFDLLYSIRNSVSSLLIKRTNEQTGGFLSALLIGDRTNLEGSTTLLFRRIGISHILALSGLHLSIITYAVLNILSFFKVKKKISISITILFTFIYMALVGFTPSITRAGLMLIIHYSLFLFARTNDSFTSLSIAVFIIVLFSPHSIFDISLWLSAFATLGIICLSELTAKKGKKKRFVFKNLLIGIINSVFASLFAVGCTLVFSVSRFDTFSVLSVISTLIFTPIIQILIYLGIALIIFGGLLPFGELLVLLSNGIKHLADFLSSFEWSLCSSDFTIIKLLTMLFTASLFSFFVFEIKRKRLALTLIISLLISIFGTGVTLNQINKKSDMTVYTTAESDDVFYIKSYGESTVICCDAINPSASFDILRLMNSEKLTYLDNLILIGYSSSTPSDLSILINNVLVNNIYIPTPLNDLELIEAEELASLLSSYPSKLRFLKHDESLHIGDYNFSLLYRSMYITDNAIESVFSLVDDDLNLIYFSRSAHLMAPLKVREIANQADTLIIGDGKSSEKFNLYLNNVSTIICADEKVIDKSLLEYIKSKESVEILISDKERIK